MKVAWISYFPVDWLTWPGVPEEIRHLPRQHPASWQRVLLEEFRKCPEFEFHVFSVRRHYPRTLQFSIGNVTFHCVKVPRGMRTLSLFWWETALIRQTLKRVQPDVVHAWGTERGAAMVAQRLGYPYLITMQGLINWILQHVRRGPMAKMEAMLEDRSLQNARFATAESRFAVQWLKQRYRNLEVMQIEHAPDWLYHSIRREPVTHPMRFLFVGTLGELKGTDLLFSALEKLQESIDFRLVIVGTGSPAYMQSLRASVSERLWGKITFRQGLTPAEVGEEMRRAGIMLFPTRVDNSPNSVKEAAVAGLPVVASNVGGIPDYIQHGMNGMVFTPGDLEGFEHAVRSACNHPLFGMGRVEPETLRTVRSQLAPDLMARQFRVMYSAVATGHRVV